MATLGSLYLTLAAPGLLGPAHAASVILGILVLNALGVAAMSRGLPEPDRGGSAGSGSRRETGSQEAG